MKIWGQFEVYDILKTIDQIIELLKKLGVNAEKVYKNHKGSFQN
jgi:hypothetical protein